MALLTMQDTNTAAPPIMPTHVFPIMCVTPHTLSRRVLPYREEPAHAYASRLARYHGLPSLRDLCSRHLPVSSAAIRNGEGQTAIERLAGWSPGIFAPATAMRGSGHWQIGKQRFRLSDWSHRCLKVCPACLKADYDDNTIGEDYDYRPHQRTWWNLTVISACHTHGCSLVPVDPDDVDLTHHLELPYASASSGALLVARLIVGRLGFAEPIEEPPYTKSIALDRMLDVAELIGQLDQMAGSTPEAGDADALDEARETGIAILLNGEQSISEALARIISTMSPEKLPTPCNSFGDLYKWFKTHQEATELVTLKTLFIDHCLDHLLIDGRQGLFKDRVRDARQIRMSSAARGIGCDPQTLVRLLRYQRHHKADESLFPATLIPASSAKVLARIARTMVQPKHAAHGLGLATVQFKELVAANVLHPLIEGIAHPRWARQIQPVTSAKPAYAIDWWQNARPIFSSAHLDRQVGRLLADLPAIENISRNHVLLVKAPSLLRSLTLVTLLNAIRGGRLAASLKRVGDKAPNLQSVVLLVDDVVALEAESRQMSDGAEAKMNRQRRASEGRIKALHKKGLPLLTGGLRSSYPPPSRRAAAAVATPRLEAVQLEFDLSGGDVSSSHTACPAEALFTLDQLANRWRCNRRDVLDLISIRQLRSTISEPRSRRVHRPLITADALHAFEEGFVSLRELDSRLVQPREAIIRDLLMGGLLKKFDATDATFFPRTAALKLFSLD